MIKRMAVILLLLLLLPASALGKIETRDVEESSFIYISRITTFEDEAPALLKQALLDAELGEGKTVCGAMHEYVLKPGETQADMEPSHTALLALERNGVCTLAGLSRDDGEPWRAVELGEKMLLSGRAFTIAMEGDRPSEFVFQVRYPTSDGGMESYAFRKASLWEVDWYQRTDAQGAGWRISSFSDGFIVDTLPTQEGSAVAYNAYLPVWTEYMDSIAAYPTTEEELKNLVETTWTAFDGTDIAAAGGVNLRTKATSHSDSLGVYGMGTLVHVLGQEKGRDAPWYHVRVGHVEGWMRGVYVAFPRTREFVRSRGYIPLPVGRANQTVTLRTAMSDQSEAVCEVAQDTLMHVLNEPVNGWVHVMIPQGELSWQMDSDGTSGYLRVEEITQGWSVKEMAAR